MFYRTYSYLVAIPTATGRDKEVQRSKAKGVRRAYKEMIPFDKFLECLRVISKVDVSQVHIRAKNHRIFTLEVTKTAFNSYDEKRFIYPCGIHTDPYDSCRITNSNGKCPFCVPVLDQ